MNDEKFLQDEALNDEQLDQVAGGDWNEMFDDARRFKKMGIKIQGSDAGPMGSEFFICSLEVAFEKFGVTCVASVKDGNRYYINGKQVSQDQAWEQVYSKNKK